jgi:UDP-N-acetylglucosamine--N-acetylmuramyl-(pentapeptide) pyrophosphoryl-undecaprenol N-acetylglucosamine transferase
MIAARDRLPAAVQERYRPFAFAGDLAQVMRTSDLVLSRAGASTLSEVSALGIPMILVPGAFARGHQRLNAEPYARAGAAVVIEDAECDGPRLCREVLELHGDPARYRAMGEAVRRLGRPNAAEAVVELLRQAAMS